MAQYIDKDALVAEIKERIETYNKGYANGDGKRADALDILLHDLNTFEVKEVDLEKEIYDVEKRFGDIDEMSGYRILIFDDEFRDILHHFFELGLKAQKEE